MKRDDARVFDALGNDVESETHHCCKVLVRVGFSDRIVEHVRTIDEEMVELGPARFYDRPGVIGRHLKRKWEHQGMFMCVETIVKC